MDDEETWRSVPSFEGVMASSWGRLCLPPSVACMPKGGERIYTPKPAYGTVARANSKAKHCYRNIFNRRLGNIKVHRAVCEAFHGPCPVGLETLHLDEDGLNNRPENLRWGTRKENLNAPGFKNYCRGRTGDNSSVAKGLAKRKDEATND